MGKINYEFNVKILKNEKYEDFFDDYVYSSNKINKKDIINEFFDFMANTKMINIQEENINREDYSWRVNDKQFKIFDVKIKEL